jgi:hypothetical protein
MRRRFLLNRRSGILHRLPSTEECNCDAIPRPQRRYFARARDAAGTYLRLCQHCTFRSRRT